MDIVKIATNPQIQEIDAKIFALKEELEQLTTKRKAIVFELRQQDFNANLVGKGYQLEFNAALECSAAMEQLAKERGASWCFYEGDTIYISDYDDYTDTFSVCDEEYFGRFGGHGTGAIPPAMIIEMRKAYLNS